MQTNGIKQTEGKTSYSEIDWSFIEKMAKCMNLNKGKYPPKNWQKPMEAELLLDAAQRHLIELHRGELFDKENGAEHAVAIALNMMMYSYQQNNCNTKLHDFGPKWGQELLDDLNDSKFNVRQGIVFGKESQKALDARRIENLQKELEDKYLEIENLQKLFKNQQALYLKEKENNKALSNNNYFLSCTNQALKKEIDDNIKKELEAIKNSSKGECSAKAESSVDTQAIINSINDLYLKLNKPISPLRDSTPFPEFPYVRVKYYHK